MVSPPPFVSLIKAHVPDNVHSEVLHLYFKTNSKLTYNNTSSYRLFHCQSSWIYVIFSILSGLLLYIES